MRIALARLVVLLVLSRMSMAQAATITYHFSGNVIQIIDNGHSLGDLVKVGDTFTASYTFDSGAPDLEPGRPEYGRYDAPPSAMTATVGGLTLVSGTSNLIQVSNYASSDSISFGASDFDSGGIHVSGMGLYFLDYSATAIGSDALPVQPLHLTEFNIARFQIEGNAFGNPVSFAIDGILVPEPGSLGLLLLLSAVFLRRQTCL